MQQRVLDGEVAFPKSVAGASDRVVAEGVHDVATAGAEGNGVREREERDAEAPG
jgi:hypothetical protein